MPEQRLSPLYDFQSSLATLPKPRSTGVYLTERPFRGYLNLRGNAQDAAFVQGVQESAATVLPLRPNTISQNEVLTILCLGPDEWLLVIEQPRTMQILSALRAALLGLHVAITDLSDGQTLLLLAGPNANDVLQAGCSLDLHPSVFKEGQCAQTALAKAGVILWRADEASEFFLIVRRSFSEYVALWIQDAATSYGFQMM